MRCGYLAAANLTVCDTGGGVVRGDLGTSLDTKQPVWERLTERMWATMELGILSLFVSLLIGVPLGVLSAVNRGSMFDNTDACVRRALSLGADLLDGFAAVAHLFRVVGLVTCRRPADGDADRREHTCGIAFST